MAQVQDSAPARTDVPGGTETILVAEDNSQLRALIKEVLERKGYNVIQATDGDDAVRKFKERKDGIDLLILDVVMPKMNGKEAYEEITRLRPDAKAFFTSGYTGDVVLGKGIRDELVNYISKPLSPNDLLLKVREVLDK
jgi:CheY-like chemotaxis protein